MSAIITPVGAASGPASVGLGAPGDGLGSEAGAGGGHALAETIEALKKELEQDLQAEAHASTEEERERWGRKAKAAREHLERIEARRREEAGPAPEDDGPLGHRLDARA